MLALCFQDLWERVYSGRVFVLQEEQLGHATDGQEATVEVGVGKTVRVTAATGGMLEIAIGGAQETVISGQSSLVISGLSLPLIVKNAILSGLEFFSLLILRLLRWQGF